MSTIRTDFFRTLVNQSFEDIFYEKSNYYFFLGKVEPWDSETDEPEFDTFPRTSKYDRRIRDNILYMNKIRPTDSSIVTRRIVWESGKIFDFWDHRVDMEDKDFYCINSNLNVYKCLYNGNGAPSTVEPTLRSVEPFRTSDGYLWKYMYTIDPTKAKRFLYDVHMPVQKALTDTFYNNGAIEELRVIQGGSGYSNEQLTTIQVSDTTTGFGAEAEILDVSDSGQILDIDIIPDVLDSAALDSDSELIESDGTIIDSTGEEYFEGARVTINSSTGAGAVIEPVIVEGRIVDFNIVEPGVGYQVTDTVDITVGHGDLTPIVSPSSGKIVDVKIADPGIGYESDPSLTVLPVLSGTGIYGNDFAVIRAQVFEGRIVNVTIEDPGIDYPADSETVITVSGDGEGAAFVPVIDSTTGQIVSASVESAGKGYTYAVVDVIGPGTGARLEAVIKGSDILSDQPVIEQTAVDGAIYAVNVTNPGNNYSSETTVTIEGDGSGAAAYPVIDDGGQINEIIMSSYGSGYSYATLTINDPNRNGMGAEFIDASAYPILPPVNGHGFNAVAELYGRTLGVYSVARYDDVLESIPQEYRQYGILRNPRTISGNQKITDNITLTTFDLGFDNVENMNVDEVLINNDIRYRVVTIDGTRVRLQQLSSIYKIPSKIFAKESDPNQTYRLSNVFSAPTVNKYSGDMLYSTNKGIFEPAPDRSLTIRTYLEFKTS